MRFASVLAFSIAVYAALPAQAQLPTADCSGAAAERNAPEVGDACAAIISDPKSNKETLVEALFYRGIWHHRARRSQAAARDYDRGLELAPDHAKLLQLRAMLLRDAGKLAGAKAMALKSLKLDPTRSKTFELLGNIAHAQGEDEQALTYFNSAIDASSTNIYARYERAELLSGLRRPGDALSDTEWLVSQAPTTVDREGTSMVDGHIVPLYLAAEVAHAKVLRQLDRYEDAESYYGKIISGQRTSFTLTQRSRFLSGLPIGSGMANRVQEALADVEEAVRLDPRDGRAQLQLATLLEILRRYGDALAAVDLAIQYEQRDSWVPAATWLRARLLRGLGRTDEATIAARRSLRTALQVNPTFLMDRLSRLEQLGYWLEPPSEDKFEASLEEAAAACMVDEKCF